MFKFPYTNLHELNLDWILEKVKHFAELIPPMETAVDDVQALTDDVAQAVEDANQAVEDAQSAIETAEEAKEIAEQAAQGTIADGAVTTPKLDDDAVTTAKIADGAVTGNKIGTATIQTGNLSQGCVTTVQILDGTITDDDLGTGCVTADKLGASAVTTGKIVDGAVTTAKLDSGAVTNAKIADDAVTAVKIDAPSTIESGIGTGSSGFSVNLSRGILDPVSKKKIVLVEGSSESDIPANSTFFTISSDYRPATLTNAFAILVTSANVLLFNSVTVTSTGEVRQGASGIIRKVAFIGVFDM